MLKLFGYTVNIRAIAVYILIGGLNTAVKRAFLSSSLSAFAVYCLTKYVVNLILEMYSAVLAYHQFDLFAKEIVCHLAPICTSGFVSIFVLLSFLKR